MATGLPRARRLGEDGPRELDDIPPLIQEDVATDCLHVLCDGVLLTVSMTMSEVDATDDLRVREDLDVDSILMIPSRVM